MKTTDLILKSLLVGGVVMVGCVVGRIVFLAATVTAFHYFPSAAGIEFLWVAPFGAVPAAILALWFLAGERRYSIRQLRRLSKRHDLPTDTYASILIALELLEEQR